MLRLLEGGIILMPQLPADSLLRASLEAVDRQGSVAVVCELAAGGCLTVAAERGAESVTPFVNKHELAELRAVVQDLMTPAGEAATASPATEMAAGAAAE